MGAVLYGAQVWQTYGNPINYRNDYLGADSEAFNVGDVVSVNGDTAGVLAVVDAATEAIAGVSVKAATMAATNDSTYHPYIAADLDTVWLMGTNSDLTDNETDGGTFYGLTGLPGAIQVNVSAGVTTTTSRQVMIVKVDPYGIGGTGSGSGKRQVLVKFVRITQFSGAFN